MKGVLPLPRPEIRWLVAEKPKSSALKSLRLESASRDREIGHNAHRQEALVKRAAPYEQITINAGD